jgi:hypothetical protein
MNLKTPGSAGAPGVSKETLENEPTAPCESSRRISVPHVGPVKRKEELAGRLDLPGRPGGLKKPVAQQPEKDMFRNAVPER